MSTYNRRNYHFNPSRLFIKQIIDGWSVFNYGKHISRFFVDDKLTVKKGNFMTDNSIRTKLFSPTRLGEIELANRIVMAPLT
ncbi:hypothetical protein, partial [Xenorhabdus bovienii]|uniref:hypothetical protein n=1 Tax=Xenorhabdus bovienii TaxID=40576 RepID=UPI0023B259A4